MAANGLHLLREDIENFIEQLESLINELLP